MQSDDESVVYELGRSCSSNSQNSLLDVNEKVQEEIFGEEEDPFQFYGFLFLDISYLKFFKDFFGHSMKCHLKFERLKK
jgi:hypothetical protein